MVLPTHQSNTRFAGYMIGCVLFRLEAFGLLVWFLSVGLVVGSLVVGGQEQSLSSMGYSSCPN